MRHEQSAVINRLAALGLALAMAGCAQTPSDAPANPPAPETPASATIFAAQYGQPTLDRSSGGGNPFATAFIAGFSGDVEALDALPRYLKGKTLSLSQGVQDPEVPQVPIQEDLPVDGAFDGSRIALVLIQSDYSRSEAASLPGARRDAERIATALEDAGYDTTTLLDVSSEALASGLDAFRQKSQGADVALIYSTGHGIGLDRETYLLSGSYPLDRGPAALETHAIPVSKLSEGLGARSANLVFWAGCRDDPLQWSASTPGAP
ncbi:MAG: caspase family protein [Pseudomonadota bacterium]